MRKIVICMDGTGNEVGDNETNVLKLYKSLDQNDDQLTHYVQGVGTYDGSSVMGRPLQKLYGVLGLAFGLGLEDDVLEAYRYLCTSYQSAKTKAELAKADDPGASEDNFEDDRIYILGFSRGAYAARVLAGFINNFGLVDANTLHLIGAVFRAYRRVTEFDPDADPDEVFKSLRQYEKVLRPDRHVPIRFLGLFDTVNSMIRLGRPLHNLRRYGSLAELATHASVAYNPSVRIVCHALAIDERRTFFRALPWDDSHPVYYGDRFRRESAARTQYVRQRWFAGYHGDIGGSPPEDESGIGKLTALWLLDALETAEKQANAEDTAKRKAAGKPKLPKSKPGLKLRRGHEKAYFLGEPSGNFPKTTPGGKPYCGPDPMADIHPSISLDWQYRNTWGWLPLEILIKSLKRREKTDPPAWFRRGFLYYLPLKEPRYIPEHHEIDPSVFARMAEKRPKYAPENVTGGFRREVQHRRRT